jgi:folate-binding protein YgfZ
MTHLEDYQAVREGGAGIIDLSSRGRISVGGSEAVMFLNGLITNDMKTLEPQRWMPAVFPNVQGRMIAAVRVVRLQDEENSPRFLLDTEAATHAAVLKTIERFTMAGDFKVVDITGDTLCFSVQGKQALSKVRSVFLDEEPPHNGVAQTSWNAASVTAIRASHTAEDGVDVFVDRPDGFELVERFANAGVVRVDAETLETLRIEAGVARFGVDMDETNVVSETNLDDAISFTKGCYIGQEIIARIKYRGHVAKKLTGLTLEGTKVPVAGAVIRSNEKDIGRVTSATLSPKLDSAVALGYVRYEYLATGTQVVIGAEGLAAKVTDLPFVRGSWYKMSDEL